MTKVDLAEIEQFVVNDGLQKKIRNLEGQLARARIAPAQLKAANREITELHLRLDEMTSLDGIAANTLPGWLTGTKVKRQSKGIACLCLSDLHLDEVVAPDAVVGMNAYGREIAEHRLKETIRRAILLAGMTSIKYEGLVLFWNGDTTSGDIHDELKRTNVAPLYDTLNHFADPILTALEALADFFGKVHIVVRVGNHGRSTRKPESKDQVRSNSDWFFARNIARCLRNDARFTWDLPDAPLGIVRIYDTRFLVEHGHAFRGGDQIAGPLRPVMKGYKDRLAEGHEFDVMIVGHFHCYAALPRVIMNGSLVGYNEFAQDRHYAFEPPKQALWIVTPANGPMSHTAVLPMDRDKEGW